MTFRIDSIDFHVLPMRTRLPFRYGIATLTSLPHLLVRARLVVDDQEWTGQSADGLPPKWFTKDPETPHEIDLAEMIAAIQNAGRIGLNAAERPRTFFEWWQDLTSEQTSWAGVREVPPLLAGFGTSLIERAILDALCRAAGRPLWKLLQENTLRIDLKHVRRELNSPAPQIITNLPPPHLHVRHTVGLADPLSEAEIPPGHRIDDGLPQSLEASISRYGLRSFKLKLSGNLDDDRHRLGDLAMLMDRLAIDAPSFTMDGNEHFLAMADFRAYWEELAADSKASRVLNEVRFIEQPVHRSEALDSSVGKVLGQWNDRPPIIIDESDGSLDDLPRALELGYDGTSHKNCKGIVKGLANAALLRNRPNTVLSGEDLANVGPVALQQDLAMMAILGVDDVERNGHHYFRGLSALTAEDQSGILNDHPDLYTPLPDSTPTLALTSGKLSLQSVNESPFGCRNLLALDAFEPLNTWIKRGGMTPC